MKMIKSTNLVIQEHQVDHYRPKNIGFFNLKFQNNFLLTFVPGKLLVPGGPFNPGNP